MLSDDHDWVRHYRPSTKTIWVGRSDGPGAKRFHEVMIVDDLRQPIATNPDTLNFGLIGFASDEGVKRNHGRTGASRGPQVFREALAKLPIHVPHDWKFFDMGDIVCDDGDLEGAQESLARTVESLLTQGVFPLVIGGGHEVAWGNFKGIMRASPETVLSLINFDAHFDIRRPVDGKGTSGTSYSQIFEYSHKEKKPFFYSCFGVQSLGNTAALFEDAKILGVRYLTAEEFHLGKQDEIASFLRAALDAADGVYLSLCLDVFAAPFAPGVSAPQPLGLFPYHAIPLLKAIARSGKVVAFDIAELCPDYDRDNRTANLAATLLSSFLHELSTAHYARGPLSCCG